MTSTRGYDRFWSGAGRSVQMLGAAIAIVTSAEPEQEAAPEDMASRLRAALGRIDPSRLAEGAASLRESRENDEREAAQEAKRAREAEAAKVREREREREAQEKDRERSRDRDSGWDYGL